MLLPFAMAIGSRRIVIIQGHPDPEGGHFCHALAAAYEHGAREKGHSVEVIDVARMEVPFIRSRTDHAQGAVPEPIRLAQLALLRADHLVIVHPVWNGGAPARLRAFMEQAFRPGFMFPDAKPEQPLGFSAAFTERKALKGKSGRVITTMQMPGFVYRWLFRPHQEAGALRLGGARPVRETPIGMVEAPDGSRRQRWILEMARLGGEAG